MLDLLIKKNEYNQTIILGATILHEYQAIEELTRQLEISKSSLFRYLAVINQELAKRYPIAPSISSDGVYLHLNNPGGLSKNHLFITSLKNYLKNSIPFNLLLTLLKTPRFPTNDLLDILHISHSYLNKQLKELNTYIKATKVTIYQRKNHVYLDGPETSLTVFKLLLKNNLLSLEEGTITAKPVNHFSELFTNQTLSHLTMIQRHTLDYLEEIAFERSDMGYHITITDKEITQSLSYLLEHHNLLKDNTHLLTSDTILFLNLITRFIFPKIDGQEERIAIAKAFLKQPNSLTRDTEILLDAIATYYGIQLPKHTTLYFDYFYQGMMSFLYMRLLGYNFNALFTLKTDKIDGFYIYNHADYVKIKELTSLPVPFTNPDNEQAFRENSGLFTSSIFTAVRQEITAQLAIYLNFQSQLAFESYLKSRIEATFNSECLFYCQTIDEADLIITDTFMETSSSQQVFTFLDTNSSFSMRQLLRLLMDLYTEKLMTPT